MATSWNTRPCCRSKKLVGVGNDIDQVLPRTGIQRITFHWSFPATTDPATNYRSIGRLHMYVCRAARRARTCSTSTCKYHPIRLQLSKFESFARAPRKHILIQVLRSGSLTRFSRESAIMSVTPVSEKTVSMTAKDQQGPTPKNEFKKPVSQRSYFMSPTDAMVSPCTQKLMHSRVFPRKMPGNPRPGFVHPASKLANKENEMRAPAGKTTNQEVGQPAASTNAHA